MLDFPRKPYKTHGGVHAPHRKNTADFESVEITAPKQVVIAMSQHIGAPCKPTVKAGDIVDAGQVIGDSDSFVSAPVHASVSGKVSKIIQITMPSGAKCDAVVIDNDFEMRMSSDIHPPVVKCKEDLVAAARKSGLVGLGGAGFPAHIKLNTPQNREIDTLLVNMAECEPYITSDNREALENSWALMSGIYAIKDILGIHRVIIGVESNKPEVIKVLSEIAYNETADPNNEVRVLKLKASYPQGAEKVLVQACTGRKIPVGKLPSDVGVVVMNITSIAFLSTYLKTGIPLIKKRITVDGGAISEPKNVIVPIGTPIKDVVEFCGGYRCEPKKILAGGPMMGLALIDDEFPILKQNNAILFFNEKEAQLCEPSDCIRCGRCVKSCPMSLMPTVLSNAVKLKDVDELKRLNIMTCMECGCCAFSCPASKPLVQTMRIGKQLVKNSK